MLQPGEVDHEVDRGQLVAPPCPVWDTPTLATCTCLYEHYVGPAASSKKAAGIGVIPDSAFCDLPLWVFLEYLVQFRDILLVGSNQPDLTRLEPVVLSQNVYGWGEPRLYAFANSTEALFRALLDSDRLKFLDCGSKSTLTMPRPGGNSPGEQGFYFGIDYRALPHAPWRPGTVYLYARADFPPDYQTVPYLPKTPVTPLAKLRVRPWDWPLLHQVHGVDVLAQTERQRDTFRGYPWADDPAIHPHRDRRLLAEQTRSFLETCYADPVDLPQLGRRLGISPFAVLRLFRSHTGLSPREYQTLLRVQQARRLLQEGQPIAQVAAETGFADQTHLTRHFRQILGITPGQYLRVQESPIRRLAAPSTLSASSTR